jgi:hypothetical protein
MTASLTDVVQIGQLDASPSGAAYGKAIRVRAHR